MEAERLIRILQRLQKPEGEFEQMSLLELDPYAAGLQKAIEIIQKIENIELELLK